MCKIVIPVSFIVMLLEWSGWLSNADFILNPLMNLIYAAIASMTVLSFTPEQMTLIAVFTLIAHNLITEGIIQYRSGINIIKITLIRIVIAIAVVLLISPFFGTTNVSVSEVAVIEEPVSFVQATGTWATDTGLLMLKIFGIIMLIMITLECMTALSWNKYLFRIARPFMKILGLSDRTAMLWVTAVVFGLMYGGAVIQEGVKQGSLSRHDVEYLHVSIGINHSMVEDPALFLALGLNGFWLWIPKLVAAIIAVQVLRAISLIMKKLGIYSNKPAAE